MARGRTSDLGRAGRRTPARRASAIATLWLETATLVTRDGRWLGGRCCRDESNVRSGGPDSIPRDEPSDGIVQGDMLVVAPSVEPADDGASGRGESGPTLRVVSGGAARARLRGRRPRETRARSLLIRHPAGV